MNFETLKSTVLARVSMGTNDPAAGAVGELVNEGLHMVETAHPWPWLRRVVNFTTVASTQTFNISSISTTAFIMRVTAAKAHIESTWLPLMEISAEEGDDGYRSFTGTGAPESYWVEGTQLFFYPTPNTTTGIRARVLVSEPDLINATDTPIMPEAYHGAIVSASLVLYYETLQDVARAESAARRFDGWLNTMMKNSRQNTHPPGIRDVY